MVPSFFVPLHALPLTPSGKLDRRALPTPERAERTYVAPRDATEALLARIVGEGLGIGQVGVHDDFVELGGDSLLAARLAARIRGEFGVELPLRVLFDGPTIGQLAERVREAVEEMEALDQLSDEEVLRLLEEAL
jgi:acyl carrier protein